MANYLIVMRGAPGSGKSTLAAFIGKSLDASIHSTDSYFYEGETYKFDQAKLGENHLKNLNAVIEKMRVGCPTIIVDNTNVKKKDAAKYIEAARLYKYDIIYLHMYTNEARDPNICYARNTHGVPLDVISRMLDSLNNTDFDSWKSDDSAYILYTNVGPFTILSCKRCKNADCRYCSTLIEAYNESVAKDRKERKAGLSAVAT